jgi:ribose transport system substrate-binding protein
MPTSARKLPVIAVFTKNATNPAYAAARMGADMTAARMGAVTRHYVPNKPDDVNEQIALIDESLMEAPDAVLMVPVHPTAINDSLKKFYAADIPVIAYINRFTQPGCITFVGSDDYPLAERIGTYLLQRMSGRGTIMIVEGPREAMTSVERVRAFHAVLRRFPRAQLVGSICGEYQQEPARLAMAEFLKSTPPPAGILVANDIMAMGVIEALEAARASSQIVGINAIPAAISAIKAGKMLGTADFNAMHMSCLATEAALRHLRGETLPGQIILPVGVIDQSNCKELDRPFEERPCPSWHEFVPGPAP